LLRRHLLRGAAIRCRNTEERQVRKLATAFGGTAAISVVAAVGWPGLVLALAVTAFVVAAACWVLNDAGRSARLTRLVRELRRRSGPGSPH